MRPSDWTKTLIRRDEISVQIRSRKCVSMHVRRGMKISVEKAQVVPLLAYVNQVKRLNQSNSLFLSTESSEVIGKRGKKKKKKKKRTAGSFVTLLSRIFFSLTIGSNTNVMRASGVPFAVRRCAARHADFDVHFDFRHSINERYWILWVSVKRWSMEGSNEQNEELLWEFRTSGSSTHGDDARVPCKHSCSRAIALKNICQIYLVNIFYEWQQQGVLRVRTAVDSPIRVNLGKRSE